MKSASPFVYVENVKDSVEYYQNIFGGEIKILNKHEGKVMHAELHLGSSLIHFSDPFGRMPKSENINIISFNLRAKTKSEKCMIRLLRMEERLLWNFKTHFSEPCMDK